MSGARRRLWVRLVLGLGIVVAAVVLGGCSADGPDPAPADEAGIAAGKALFTGACGGCHVLADAGTQGRVGPNLDDAFRGPRLQGWKNTQFEGVVRKWIEISEAPMPQNIVVGQDAANVSAYVASVAGTSPESQVRSYTAEEPEIPTKDANAPDIDGAPQASEGE